MNVQAICFDADGVLVNPQQRFSQYLSREYAITPEITRGFFRGVFNDCLVGKADLKQVIVPFLKDWGWQSSVDEFVETWLRMDHVVDTRLVERIQELRRGGMICCLATSQERNRAAYMRTRMGFQDVFDRLFFSCEIGWQKPDPAYYRFIERALGIETESILFWDDLQINVDAARACGWQAERYTDYPAFERSLSAYA